MASPLTVPAPAVPGSAAEAIAMVLTGLGWLASADVASLPSAVQADALRALEQATAVRTAAQARVLAAFTAQAGHEDDGQGSPRTWLKWQCRVTGAAAGAAVGWMRRLSAHPAVADALAARAISRSRARAVCDWTDRLPESARPDADLILLAAAQGGAGLDDLAASLAAQLGIGHHDPGGSPPGPGQATVTVAGLRELLLRHAVALLSGPGGLASVLRTGTLPRPAGSVSLPLDVGTATDTIPASLTNMVLLYRFHHLIYVHERGWTITLNADGTTTATSPDRTRRYHSHAPPATAA